MGDNTRLGLRLLEFETGVASNIDDGNSAELIDYEVSRIAGQAARMAMLIRGQDVIDDEHRLKKVLAVELGMRGLEYVAAKRLLMEADLVEERQTKTGRSVLNEKIERLDHKENYRRIGEIWSLDSTRTEKEEALIVTLDTLVTRPTELSKLDALTSLNVEDRKALLEVSSNAGIIERLDESGYYYSPLLWDVNPKKLAAFTVAADASGFSKLLKTVSTKPGTEFTQQHDPLIAQAISGGILPSYRVTSTGGLHVYSFAPYTGGMLTSETEKTILDKARALVACLRYGSEAATITQIRHPLLILDKLMDPQRNHRVGPHSELKQQYGMLLSKQLGKVFVNSQGRYYFELIPSPDNLRACRIARELMVSGEIMGQKDAGTDAAVIHLVSGKVEHPLREVKVAKKKRPARSDELADLVERLRSV